jgi:hypothetical protein
MFETFNDTCGLRMFIGFISFENNRTIEYTQAGPWERRSAAAAFPLFSALAAIFPDVIGQGSECRVVGGVIMEGALRPSGESPRVDETFQMMTERRGRKIHVGLDVPRGGAVRAGLHDEPKDLQSNGMTKRTELLGVPFELGGHPLLLTFSNQGASYFFENCETMGRAVLTRLCALAS